jgi:hypothetical protein
VAYDSYTNLKYTKLQNIMFLGGVILPFFLDQFVLPYAYMLLLEFSIFFLQFCKNM